MSRERPIIFSAPMVQALLEDRKTQTRRIVKPAPTGERRPLIEWSHHLATACGDSSPDPEQLAAHSERLRGRIFPFTMDDGSLFSPACPYGVPGDLLWVRETWYCDHFELQRGPYREVPQARELLYYRATDAVRPDSRECWTGFAGETMTPPWKPAIHMPRWASRIRLTVTDIRIERLNDISEQDCIAEGIYNGEYDPGLGDGGKPGWCYATDKFAGTLKHAYELLWDSIHGEGSFAHNPWVWVVSFKRETIQ